MSQVLPGEPFVSRQQVSQVSTVTRETDAMEKEEKLDGDATHINLDISEQEIDFPWYQFKTTTTSSTQTPCRFSRASCSRSQSPSIWCNLRSRADWLSLRGFANTECDIPPIRERVHNRTRSVGSQSWVGGRPPQRAGQCLP